MSVGKVLKGEFKETGGNEIDINAVVSYWNHLWVLTERRKDDSWKLTKQVRKDSNLIKLRLTISPDQAQELIKRLDLKPDESTIFKNTYSWKTEISTQIVRRANLKSKNNKTLEAKKSINN